MKKVEVEVYRFEELVGAAKKRVYDKFMNEVIVDEAQYEFGKVIDRLNAYTDAVFKPRDWYIYVDFYLVDRDVERLEGERLRTYIVNNLASLFECKKMYFKNGRYRRSKIFTVSEPDTYMWSPVYDVYREYTEGVLEGRNYMDFLNDIADRLYQYYTKCIEDDYEEDCKEFCLDNDMWFLKDGRIYGL